MVDLYCLQKSKEIFMKSVLIAYLALFSFLSAPISVSASADSDIYGRINDCQKSGQNQCIFDLLRELAGGQSNTVSLQSGKYGDPKFACDVLVSGGQMSLNGDRETVVLTCEALKCVSSPDSASLERIALAAHVAQLDVCFPDIYRTSHTSFVTAISIGEQPAEQ
jgi:hypothetical protein